MNILLACLGGMSTAFLQKSLQKEMQAEGVEGKVLALNTQKAKEVDGGQWDVILIGPQCKYMVAEFKGAFMNKHVAVIPNDLYAIANGKGVWNMVKNLLTQTAT